MGASEFVEYVVATLSGVAETESETRFVARNGRKRAGGRGNGQYCQRDECGHHRAEHYRSEQTNTEVCRECACWGFV